MSGFMATKYCINEQLYARTNCCARKTCRPVRQLIGQVSELGDSFVFYYLCIPKGPRRSHQEIVK